MNDTFDGYIDCEMYVTFRQKLIHGYLSVEQPMNAAWLFKGFLGTV